MTYLKHKRNTHLSILRSKLEDLTTKDKNEPNIDIEQKKNDIQITKNTPTKLVNQLKRGRKKQPLIDGSKLLC